MIVIGKYRAKIFFKTVRPTEGFSLMIIKTVRFIESFIIVNPILKRLVPVKSVRSLEVSVLQRCLLAES